MRSDAKRHDDILCRSFRECGYNCCSIRCAACEKLAGRMFVVRDERWNSSRQAATFVVPAYVRRSQRRPVLKSPESDVRRRDIKTPFHFRILERGRRAGYCVSSFFHYIPRSPKARRVLSFASRVTSIMSSVVSPFSG